MTYEHSCDDCGGPDASLVSEGYCTPYPDVDITYHIWEEYYLCNDCYQELIGGLS